MAPTPFLRSRFLDSVGAGSAIVRESQAVGDSLGVPGLCLVVAASTCLWAGWPWGPILPFRGSSRAQVGTATPPQEGGTGGRRWAQPGVPGGPWGTRLQGLAAGSGARSSLALRQSDASWGLAGRAGTGCGASRAHTWPHACRPGGQPCLPPRLGSWLVRRAGAAAGPPRQGGGPAWGGPTQATSLRKPTG